MYSPYNLLLFSDSILGNTTDVTKVTLCGDLDWIEDGHKQANTLTPIKSLSSMSKLLKSFSYFDIVTESIKYRE